MNKVSILYFCYLLMIGVIFYLMNIYTPLYMDDWHYCFIFGTHSPISSIVDILNSQYHHYLGVNGRFIPHFFIQLFDGLLGKEAFNIANSLVFIAFLYMLSYLLRKEFKSYFASTSLATLLIFFFMPGFSYCFLWMSGACNYLWSATLLLVFFILMGMDIKERRLFPLLFILGVICGWTHEGLTLGVGFGLFVYYLIKRKELKPSNLVLLIGFYVGILFLVLSPGSINRAIATGHDNFNLSQHFHYFASALLAMSNIRLLPLLIILLAVYSLSHRKKAKDFISSTYSIFLAIGVIFLFVLWTRFETEHSRFGFEFLSLLLLLKLIARFHLNRTFFFLCNLILLSASIYVLSLLHKNYKDYKNCIAQIELNKYPITTEAVKSKYHVFNRFIIHFVYYNLDDVLFSTSEQFIKEYFQKEHFCIIPRCFYDRVLSNPDLFLSFYNVEGTPFYAKRIETINVKRVRMLFYDTDYTKLPFWVRPFAHYLGYYTINEIKAYHFSTVEIGGNNYILVNKLPLAETRLKAIIVE